LEKYRIEGAKYFRGEVKVPGQSMVVQTCQADKVKRVDKNHKESNLALKS
jgi:hypothetical protein